MKRCPRCEKTYTYETLNFCLEDGEWLVQNDEPATAVLPGPKTQAQVFSTDETAVLPTGTVTAPPQTAPRSFDKRLLVEPVALAAIVLAGFVGYRYFVASQSAEIKSIATDRL